MENFDPKNTDFDIVVNIQQLAILMLNMGIEGLQRSIKWLKSDLEGHITEEHKNEIKKLIIVLNDEIVRRAAIR